MIARLREEHARDANSEKLNEWVEMLYDQALAHRRQPAARSGTVRESSGGADAGLARRSGMDRIYVARHGESTWNAERRWTGHADPPLSASGRAQAKAACEAFARQRFDAVGSSGLVRATETASIIAAALGVPLLEPMRHFDERFSGPLSGMTTSEIEARWPGFLEQWKGGTRPEIPGGEPWHAFVDRVQEGLELLRAVPGRILVVSHMGVQRALEDRFGKSPTWYENLEGLWVASE